MKLYFDNAANTPRLIAFCETGIPCDKLLQDVWALFEGISRKSKYRGYPKDARDDMIGCAWLSFLKYGHNFKPNKGTAFTFLTFCAENEFRKWLKDRYYKHLNLERAAQEWGDVDSWITGVSNYEDEEEDILHGNAEA